MTHNSKSDNDINWHSYQVKGKVLMNSDLGLIIDKVSNVR